MSVRHTLRMLGPGMLLAATSIGGSHLVLAPTAGARFGYSLLWVVLLSHAVKYHAFEFGPRLAVGQGISLLEGYGRVRGRWPLWVGLVDLVLESVGVLASVAALSASVLHAVAGGLSLEQWTAVVIAVVFLLLFVGRYGALARISLVMMMLLATGTLVAFLAAPISWTDMRHLVIPEAPAGSLLLISGLLGWMPTGVAVSIWHSLWVLEDPRYRAVKDSVEARRRRFRDGLRDMRIGYAFSTVVAVMFLCLGAAVLQPRGLVPEGTSVAVTLSRLYTDLLGDWMRPVFLAMTFFAMFTTTYTVMDGMPRTLVAAIRHLRRDPDPDRADRGRLYWGYLVGLTLVSILVVRLVPDPVVLITALAAVTFVFSPLYCGLNYWCATRLIEDPQMRPSTLHRILAISATVLLAVAAGLFLYTELILRVIRGV